MRMLFVPACVCLITWSGAIADDPKMSLEQFTGARLGYVATANADTKTTDAEVVTHHETASTVVKIDAPISIPPQDETVQASPPDNAQALVRAETAPPPKAKSKIKKVVYRSTEEVCEMLTKAAHSNDLPVPFFIRLLFQESRFSPAAVSSAGAQGIAQFMPATASGVGLENPFDPAQAIPASARLLRNLFDRFGNLGLAAAAYNAGPKRIQNWLAKKGPLPRETKGYVKIITGRPAEHWRASENGAPAVKLPRHAPCQEAAGLLAWDGPDQIPVPSIAPHRSPAPVLIAEQEKPAASKADKKSKAKAGVKIARRGTRATALIKVADAGGAPIRTASSKGVVAKKKSGKGALQLAARRQNKKVRVSRR